MNGTIDAREREIEKDRAGERERERERETTRERCNEGKPANQLATQPTDTKVMSVSSTHRQAVHCTLRLVMPQELPMESSITVFLTRQLARELLPTTSQCIMVWCDSAWCESRGESGWCSDVTSTHGAWRHAGVRFLLSGAEKDDFCF